MVPNCCTFDDTYMACGGIAMPAGWRARLAELASARKAPIHMGGSRTWNAAAKAELSPTEGSSLDTNVVLIQAKDVVWADLLLDFFTAKEVLGLRLGANLIRLVVHARTRQAVVEHATATFEQYFVCTPNSK